MEETEYVVTVKLYVTAKDEADVALRLDEALKDTGILMVLVTYPIPTN